MSLKETRSQSGTGTQIYPAPQKSAAVRRRTRDRKVAGSNPGWGAIKSTSSTQPQLSLTQPYGWG